jgi:hypothetical protein
MDTTTREALVEAFSVPPAAFPVPDVSQSVVVVEPDDARPGSWVGAPSAMLVDAQIYLAYRVRHPVGEGRGIANVVAKSSDGVHFERVAEVGKETFGAESLERPALVRTDEGRWRLYVSCATPGTSHWRVEMVEADEPGQLSAAREVTTVLPGTASLAMKDPVVHLREGVWHMWVCLHDIPAVGSADAMYTAYATSENGVDWTVHWPALEPRPGRWDCRGTRIASVVATDGDCVAYYDGRATAEQNWEEQTGVAAHVGSGTFAAIADEPLATSPWGGGGLRYLSVVDLGDRGWQLYYEVTRADGAHDLRTQHVSR